MATTLRVGDIAIIAYNTGQTDGTGNPPTVDALRFVALEPLDAGTVIYFSDRSWNGSVFAAGGSDGVATYLRPIRKPVAGTVRLVNNGVPFSDWSVDTTTGLVTLGHTTAITTGHVISGSCEFDVPVRFDTDEMKTSIEDFDNFTWGQIPLIEVRQ